MTKRPTEPHDRDEILARRALFVTTALAALQCSAPQSGSTGEPSASASASASVAPARSGSVASQTVTETPAPAIPWSEAIAEAPARGAVDGLSPNELGRLQLLEAELDRNYGLVRAFWEGTPSCDAARDACREDWRDLAKKAKAAIDVLRSPRFAPCGGELGMTGTLVERRRLHREFLNTLVDRAEEHAAAVASAFSMQGEQLWRKEIAAAKVPPPMPCLEPCMMPDIDSIWASVPFAKDSASLDTAASSPIEVAASSLKRFKKGARIFVRGHASVDEAKPADLAMARARTVADALIAAGIAKKQITIVSFDTRYPVSVGNDEAHAAPNRRVDFEVAEH
ncbi:MAG: OmpA family protein [Polyangiaceae bacterium]